MNSSKKIKKIGIIGIFANIFLFIIKIVVGVFSNSQAMIADSFNSISDVFASLMTFIGSKIASSESDIDHNFGHKKAEYIFSMFISISIFIVTAKLLYDSIVSLFLSHKVIFSWNLVIVSLITITIKFILYLYTGILNKKENNILLKSNNIDHRNDMFLTLSVLLSAILSKFNIYFIDSLVGIFISIWFLISGIKIFKESYNVLMDVAIDLETKNKIIESIMQESKVCNVENVYSLSVGYKYIVVLTICVDGNLNTFDSHEIANSVENKIKEKFSDVEDVFIHIHPI